MKGKLFIIAQVIVLVVAGVIAGATTARVLPGMTVPGGLGSTAPEGATRLTMQVGAPLTPVGTGFTYQGSLTNGGSPANGDHDFMFTLYDSIAGGSLISGPVTVTNVLVTDGLFSVTLDFGADAFNGDARYLEIAVRQSGGGSYDILYPRQAITPAPYALFALKSKGYKNVVTVAQERGDFTSIQAAIVSITDASATNRYLVWVGPGTYTERVIMREYVDIEGAGENATKITFAGSAGAASTVETASNTELRSLTVESTGGNTFSTAIYNNGASLSLLHVTAIAYGGSSSNLAVNNFSSSPKMINVTATASGGSSQNFGVMNDNGSSPTMTDVTSTGSGSVGSATNSGVANYSSSSPKIVTSVISASGVGSNYGLFVTGAGTTVTVDNSKVSGTTHTIYNDSGSTVRVGASQLSGGPVLSFGTLTCTSSYDENYISPGLNVCP